MRILQPLKEEYQSYNSHGRPILKWAGIVGAAAFPIFYGLQLLRGTKEYDSFWLRAIGALMCLALVLRERWPQRLKPYYLGWSYATFIYCMPFFFIFMSLKNGGGSIAIANTFMAVFFLILLTDWRNTLVMLFVGAALAALAYIVSTDNPTMPRDYLNRWPPFVLVVIGGSILKFSQRQIEAERLDALTALAGSIAHEMRHPLGQVQQSLRAISDLLPAPIMHTPAHALASPALERLYRQLAFGEQAVHRGLQVVSMTLDEVTAKGPSSASFSLLSAAQVTERALGEYGFESDDMRNRVCLHVVKDFTFRGDETAYVFVLFNLLKNALYYVPLHPAMTVTITVDENRIGVRDTGPGISPEIAGRLFQRFVTADKSGGTGLGLAYCRRVMHAFGGDISCQSTVGQFTQFDLSFPPLDPAHLQAHESAVIEQVRALLDGRRVLVVDDDAAQRLTTAFKLQVTGAQVDQAQDGQRAIDALTANRYDLVLLDLRMPVMDGYEFAEHVRSGAAPGNGNVAIVAHTSDAPHLARVKTRKVGMDGFVCKPASRLQLLQAILDGLGNAQRRLPAALAGKRIVLADDSMVNRKAVAGYLRHWGATVAEAGHGQEVLQTLRAGDTWDAVLLDINMPGMDGLQTARAIRALAKPCSDVPIIALTAYSDDATVQAAQAAGMTDFITKPVGPELLHDKLTRVFRRRIPAGPFNVAASVAPVLANGSAATKESGVEPLLNIERLESYRRIGMLDELLQDYMPELAGLSGKLQRQFAASDFEACLDTLHSLLGMSGEAGAQALYRAVRLVYVPMVETKSWPTQEGWVPEIVALAARTDAALRTYGKTSTAIAKAS